MSQESPKQIDLEQAVRRSTGDGQIQSADFLGMSHQQRPRDDDPRRQELLPGDCSSVTSTEHLREPEDSPRAPNEEGAAYPRTAWTPPAAP